MPRNTATCRHCGEAYDYDTTHGVELGPICDCEVAAGERCPDLGCDATVDAGDTHRPVAGGYQCYTCGCVWLDADYEVAA